MKSILFYIPKFTCWNRLSITVLFIILSSGCFPYLTHERSKAIVEGVDIDQTLEIAAKELEKDGMGSVLTLWAIRDQVITPEQAGKISELYFEYIKDMKKRFNIWHITWAISNIYRLGDDSVKTVLEKAWKDASHRAKKIHRIADKQVNGTKIYMGDAHIGGRAYARKHLVVPGNKNYLQSVEQYEKQ